jgi:hypothetical protein
MPPAGFEPAIPANDQLQTFAFYREGIGIVPKNQRLQFLSTRSLQ